MAGANPLKPARPDLSPPTYSQKTGSSALVKQIKKQTQGFSLRLLLISRYNPHQGNPSSFGTIAQIPGIYFATFLRNASIVFSIRQAIVIGPTPPGTFVISEAFGSQASKSTSPHNFPVSGSRLTPTSITTAPSRWTAVRGRAPPLPSACRWKRKRENARLCGRAYKKTTR